MNTKLVGQNHQLLKKKKDHEEIENRLKRPGFDSNLRDFNSRENLKAKKNRSSFFKK